VPGMRNAIQIRHDAERIPAHATAVREGLAGIEAELAALLARWRAETAEPRETWGRRSHAAGRAQGYRMGMTQAVMGLEAAMRALGMSVPPRNVTAEVAAPERGDQDVTPGDGRAQG